MRDGVVADIVDDDCARAGEHQRERAEEFGDTFFIAARLGFQSAAVNWRNC